MSFPLCFRMIFWAPLPVDYDLKLFVYYAHRRVSVEVIAPGFGPYVAICAANLHASEADKNKDQK